MSFVLFFIVSFLLLLLSGVGEVFAITCSSSVNGVAYDLSGIGGGADIQGKSSSYTYYMNVCGSASGNGKCAGQGAMICQLDSNNNFVSTIAYSSDSTGKPQWGPADSANPNGGVILTVQGQASQWCGGGLTARKAVITFKCDPSATTVSTFTVTENPTCVNNIVIASAGACPGGAGGASSASSGKISGGTVFIIILCVSLFVYVVAGCAYKRSKLGTSGMMESCPNNEFWTSFPGLVKDGFKFFINKCRSLCDKGASGSGGQSSYESI